MTGPEVRPLPHGLAAVILSHEDVEKIDSGWLTLADLLELREDAA